jgi:hypothetical protein
MTVLHFIEFSAIIKAMKEKWFDLETGLEVVCFCELSDHQRAKGEDNRQ